jgi:glycosyltransferase involved in cell wall biosynthesis
VKIAFLGNTARMSGVEFSTLYTARVLSSDRWKPVVIVPEEGDLTARCSAEGISYEVVPMPSTFSVGFRLGGVTLPNPFALLANAGVVLAGAMRIRGFLRKFAPDIVVTKGMASHFSGGLAGALAGVPCVWHVQDRVSERLGKLYPLVISLAGRFFANHIIADAESIASQVGLLVPHSRITIVWNGVDTGEFGPHIDGSQVRREWGIKEQELLIGAVARITPWKAQHLLLEACVDLFKGYSALKVVLVGTPLFDGDRYLRDLQEFVRRHAQTGRVIFAGFRWDLPQVLGAMDVFVHTAVEKDSSPLAVVSAMASGKTMICPRLPGIAELLSEGEDALLYTPGDSGSLKAQLARVIEDNALAMRLGKNAREKALREFGLKRFAQRCEEVFARAVR